MIVLGVVKILLFLPKKKRIGPQNGLHGIGFREKHGWGKLFSKVNLYSIFINI